MTDAVPEIRTAVVEREFAHPPDKVWRAISQPHLVAEWLLKGDFQPVVGHRFVFPNDWGDIRCEVLRVEPGRQLAYSWAAKGLESVVTLTLTPSAGGTILRMEQEGFRRDQEQAFRGAIAGWGRFFGGLDALLSRLD